MSGPPTNRCGYTWSLNDELFEYSFLAMLNPLWLPDATLDNRPNQSCCYRRTHADTGRCVWHVDPDDTDKKTIESLREVLPDSKVRDQNEPYDELLDGAELAGCEMGSSISLSRVSLRDAHLSGADLSNADLSDADLFRADLSNANLRGANLSDADLFRADLTEADLEHANLSDAVLFAADLTEADLFDANLSGVHLERANLTKIDCGKIKIDDVDKISVDSRTRVSSRLPLRSGFRHTPILSKALPWGKRAQGYEKLRRVFGQKGIDRQYRKMHFYQRKARTKEALRSGLVGQWFGNYLSRIFTGHGVMVSRVLFWTVVVLFVPMYWYGLVEGWTSGRTFDVGPLYYSIVTFVTSPPGSITDVGGNADLALATVDRQSVTQAIVLFQTYVGTVLIILLGYVLGNRDST